jgi:hypothetical protein
MRGLFQCKILTGYPIVEFESDFIKYLLGTVQPVDIHQS